MNDNSYEIDPSKKNIENKEREIPPEQDFTKAYENDIPEFAGDIFGTANTENDYYGESKDGEGIENQNEYNDGIANAAALINYGLNAAAREYGIELVVQKIKTFDSANSKNPIADLYKYLGIDTKEEWSDLKNESDSAKPSELSFKEQLNMPKTDKKSIESAFVAIKDMKELIAEVEGADPRYASLREGARAAGLGYFEYAVKDYGVRGLTELFEVLAAQKEEYDTVAEEENSEVEDNPEEEEKV
ncbi:hypothetical protein IKG10_01320 [Candidatus Saccharibacteria bacterium]|nr:hypothetical protein [Candidatus Saccharibacteria bacterium]